MPLSVTLAKISLALLAGAGLWSTLKLGSDDGLFNHISNAAANGTISGTDVSLRTHWTNVKSFDGMISGMISFFWPILDGQMPELSLLTFSFIGQFYAIWILLYVESLRPGNSWKLVSFITVVGLLQENVASAFITPLYCLLQLSTSLTLRFTTAPFHHKASLLAHPAELRVLPWSVLIGSITPVVLSLYCSRETTSPFWKSRQFWIAARLLHPVYTGIMQPLFSYLSFYRDPLYTSAAQRNQSVFFELSKVYAVARYVAIVPHAACMTLVTLNSLVPSLFAERYRGSFTLAALFRLTPFWTTPSPQVSSVAQGSFVFLQWDELITVASVLIWAIALNRNALAVAGRAPGAWLVVVKTTALTLIGGPILAAISFIEERDRIVLCELDDVEKDTDKKVV